MGCVDSKLVLTSMSLREELNQRTTKGISTSANDPFCVSHEPAIELARDEACKLSTDSNHEEVKQVEPPSPLLPKYDLAKRSRSCHWFHDEYEMSSLASERYDGIKMGNRQARSRSFHTVEEYDAMVAKMLSSRAMPAIEQTGFNGREDSSLQLHHSKIDQEIKQSDLENVSLSQAEGKTVFEGNGVLFSSRSNNSSTITKESNIDDAAQKGNKFEKGFKRKAIADGLESLEIPTTIEFPNVASLGEWLHVEGQVCSPGAYVTPKFGSYALPISESKNKCIEGTVFDPELVAAFNECMEQLEEEEERILTQIEENFTNDKQDEWFIPSHLQEQVSTWICNSTPTIVGTSQSKTSFD